LENIEQPKYAISWKILNIQIWDFLENIEQPKYGISWKILNNPIMGYPGKY